MEDDRSSRRHRGSGRRGGKSGSGSSTRVIDQRYRCRVTPASTTARTSPSSSCSSSTSSLSTVRRSTDRRRLAHDGSFHFHSSEGATDCVSSPAAEATAENRWLAAGTERCKTRRKSDLGSIVEPVKASTLNAVDSPSTRVGFRTSSPSRGGIQSPPSEVPRRSAKTSSSSRPETSGVGERNLRTASTNDDRPPNAASGPQGTLETGSSTAARPGVLALSDHITCLRQKNLRCRDDVITSGDHVTSISATEPTGDEKCVNGEW